MSRKAKGKRPSFFENPEVDRVLAIVMAVAGEVSVLRDRLDTMERLLDSRGVLSRDDIEAYRPDDAVEEERQAWRSEYLERVLRVVHHELESDASGESRQQYEDTVKEHQKELSEKLT